ncbi:phosphoenolpyruvate carboxylase [Emcibacter sp.]|uniref:phosphoenolpyruvate carboxylase n=1 Tax=Emcibacter sp. TaxID=1979954 RepID=UPI002AA5EE9F|nr:phosphoenolpyruvate carboxylase [Emcibacter sp.]
MMSPSDDILSSSLICELQSDLAECLGLSRETPLVNPYQQLSYRLLNKIKSGTLSVDQINETVSTLGAQGFVSRGRRARSYLKETDADKNRKGLVDCFKRIGEGKSFAEFQNLVSREIAGIVITGHPTFGFSHDQYDLLSGLIDGSRPEQEILRKFTSCTARPDDGLSLQYEFGQSERALMNLQHAIGCLYGAVVDVARNLYPDDWRTLDLKLVTAASWVGFDVDGRDDITWMDSVEFRFRMALEQCQHYLGQWQALAIEDGSTIADLLGNLKDMFDEDIAHLPGTAGKIEPVRAFGRHMVESRAARGDLMSRVLEELDHLIADIGDEDRVARLLVFRGLFANFRTGFSHIHFRLNAVQLHNAIRPIVALEKDPDDATSRRRYMTAASKFLDRIKTQTTGFETILHEQTTARRLFMIIAQILKYIDPETPIRFLIAECDTPFTVLSALCYARLFGVDDKVDISPLFETDQALARGAEVIEELLENPHYFAYVKKRGRLCVQAGYSDAGRYLGQVAAGLAIERLRIKLIKLWTKFDLEDVELVIFDTGGESLGRGAHPEGFGGRLDYFHSPEARRQVEKHKIDYKQEFSLQGGDGYLWLHTPDLALATLSRVMENLLSSVDYTPDPFYENTDWSLDFFLTVKGYNNQISANTDFMRLISILGTDISYPSGSRMTVRQDEGVISRPLEKLSQIRAIPNNMLLHQLGYLANSLGGVGTALLQDDYGFWKMYQNSPRLRHIMTLVTASLDVTDEDFLGAYTSLFRPRYWMHSARYEEESHDHDRMLRLAKMLEKHGVYEGLNRIELTLREDLMYLRDGIKGRDVPSAPYSLSEEERTSCTLLHVVRMALVQKIFLLITRIPRFRDHKGLSVDDLVLRILRFQVLPTLDLLREIFPLEGAYEIDPENPEKITFAGDDAHGYEYENREIFDEIEQAYDQLRKISQALSAYIGAFG